MQRLTRLIRYAVLLLPLWSTGAAAQEADSRVSAEAYRVAREIMSPFCPGMTLAECPSGKAADLRREITVRLGAGESRAVIVERLVERYGEQVRGEPAARGIALSLWIVPAVVGLVLIGTLRMTTGRRTAPEPLPITDRDVTDNAALQQRLTEALEDLD